MMTLAQGAKQKVKSLGGRIFGGFVACLGFVAFSTHLVLRECEIGM
jgi:hypothetical protein